MKVTYQTCCGVDVHKSFLVATIVKTTGGIEPFYQKKRFSTFNNSILEFKQWLLDNDCHDVCMESTGKYWVPVFNLLEDKINVTIANPKWVKAVKGNKDDTKDSKWIGDLFRLGLVKGSYVPCKAIRILREYTRYRYKLTSCRSSEKNRYQNALTVCNIALDSVVSDIFGKSSTSIIDYLLEQSGTSINHEEIASKLLRSLKSKENAVIESVEGYQMTDEAAAKTYEYMKKSVDRTLRWAARGKKVHNNPNQALFGIVQGGEFEDLREYSCKKTVEMDFDGYSIGGTSVGEDKETMYKMIDYSIKYLPFDKPRYLMGVGTPEDLLEGVLRGVDMFDCVLPTRIARHGQAFTRTGKINFNKRNRG